MEITEIKLNMAAMAAIAAAFIVIGEFPFSNAFSSSAQSFHTTPCKADLDVYGDGVSEGLERL